ncbi:MAG: response regulator [Holosporales bacterium]|jgi:two-component system cell cycle sensor histidine kinase/response regulator CckA|nr:response regulator [Holosporales bacterium]
MTEFPNILNIHNVIVIIFFVIICLLIFAYYKLHKAKNNADYYLNVIRTVSKALQKNYEIVAFDEGGNVIYTTHPSLYLSKTEFIRSISKRVMASAGLQRFQNAFEKNAVANELISGSGNGLSNSTKKWIANSHSLQTNESLVKEEVFVVSLCDVSKHIDHYDRLVNNLEKLEIFLDKFPFGIFYINKLGVIIGANSTLSSMLMLKRERLIGLLITDFIEEFNSNLAEQRPTQVTIKPKFTPSFKAVLMKSSVPSNSSGQPWILYKLESAKKSLSNVVDTGNEFLEQVSFMSTPIPSIVFTVSGEIVALNPAFATLIQDNITIDQNKFLPQKTNIIDYIQNNYNSKQTFIEYLQDIFSSSNSPPPLEIKFLKEDSVAMAYISKLNIIDKKLILMQIVDISSQKRLEQQFIQSQKMQAVGQLAGGVAHDFNNLLTAMIGFCDLLLQRYIPSDPSYGDVIQIKQNADRAANLVRQLLALSKQQTMNPKVISITENLAELSSLLRRLIGTSIDFKMVHERNIWPVKVDNSQLEQVIINLVVNARDAMEGKDDAELVIESKNFSTDTEFKCFYDIAPPGEYILIEVTDNGIGISPEAIKHIFEPFFTQKESKSGTGLGLSTVSGIINQAGGFINVISKEGEGSTFQVYLPMYHGPELIQDNNSNDIVFKDLSGSETILIVEDEDAVRMFASRALRNKGYRVIEANCAEEALRIVHNGEKFDLLITDIIMPRMDGPTLNNKLREIVGDLKTIFMSGYTEDTFRKNLGKDSEIHFLQKPFTLKNLAIKVREVLRPS